MLLIQTKKGKSFQFNLQEEKGLEGWNKLVNSSNESISTIGIIYRKETHAIPIPIGFKKIEYSATLLSGNNGKPIGERVSIKADDLLIELTVYYHPRKKWTSMNIRKVGRQVYQAGGS